MPRSTQRSMVNPMSENLSKNLSEKMASLCQKIGQELENSKLINAHIFLIYGGLIATQCFPNPEETPAAEVVEVQINEVCDIIKSAALCVINRLRPKDNNAAPNL